MTIAQLKKEVVELQANFDLRSKVENDVKCPKCGSTQVHAEKRGFTLTRL
jgi:hypothetical protein